MPTDYPSRRTMLRTIAAFGAVSAASLTGCGGGGAEEPELGASSLTIGPITGFGSVIVNGVAFDDSAATVSDDDGLPMSVGALALGMTVEVDSELPEQANARAVARAIRFGWEIVGPVTAIDVAAGELRVLDQVVRIGEQTCFGESLGAGLPDFALGQVVAVNGFIDVAAGAYVATRIEARPDATAYRLRGRVADLDLAAGTCRIGAALITFAGLGADRLPRDLREGLMVRATLAKDPVGGRWVAQMIRHAIALAAAAASLPRVHVRGAITEFTSATDFKLDGLAVDASAAAFPDGRADLGLGVRVEVLGLLRDGVLVAARVEIDERHWRDRHGVRLAGPVSRVDVVARRMSVRGVPVAWNDLTRFDGGVETDLAVGVKVEVAGVIAFDRRVVRALRIRIVG